MAVTPQEEVHPGLQTAVQGVLLGGAPAITGDTKLLGAQERAGVPMSITALKQVERLGSMAGLEMTKAATRLKWPAYLRKVCMERTATQVLNVLPLAVPAPMAAARLNSLQGRWAHQVLRGTRYHMDKRLTRAQIHKVRRDLGWTPLWDIAKEYAIMLYQRMRNEPPGQPHTEWAMQDPPPKGTWVAYVRSMQKSHMIQDLALPAHVQQSPRVSQRKGQIRKYAKQIVRPRVGKAAMTQREGGLPWAWMAKNLNTKEHIRCFEQWWVWRIQENHHGTNRKDVPYAECRQHPPQSMSSMNAQRQR